MKPPLPADGRFQELAGGVFRFACHPGVSCFNQCCRRLNLVLTPYDVLRLKEHLGITAGEFLDRFAEIEHGQNGWPVPMLKMADNPERTCPFLSPQGCTVYQHRPGACRTYPLGRATKRSQGGQPGQEAYFLVREDHCRGFEQGRQWTPREWMQDQGLESYNYMNDLFMPLITRQAPDADPRVIAQKMRMFFMACYNLDAFRRFVTESKLAQRFEVDPNRLEVMARNDMELLKFAIQWLRLAIFGDPTLALRPGAAGEGPRAGF